jgi:hypothetical protein
MPDQRRSPRAPSTLSFKIGRWVEASASGWGIVALTILALVLSAAVIVGRAFY